ncbi:MAG: glycosyltransferase family 2 protein [Prevotella sp.]|nr:glycosyltransferase family 2 protein [Candidatus Prevotella equi]
MITVAITVYNRAKYIAECLESVMNQTYSDMEILCVDDVSTDGSYEILQQYAAKDSRIRLFRNEKNSGAQVSRNLALKEARGEYIIYIDDDDWLSLDCLEQCMKELKENPEVDLLFLRDVRVNPDGTQFDPDGRQKFTKVRGGGQTFLWSMPWQVSGFFICTTDLQRRYPWDNSCRNFGDENTGRNLLLHANCIMQSKAIYYYRILDDSVSHKLNMGQFTRLEAQHSLAVQLKDEGIDTQLLAAYEKFRWLNIIHGYWYYYENRRLLSEKQKGEALRIIRNMRSTIDFAIIPCSLKFKFGYSPIMSSWRLFRLEENLYFFFKALLRPVQV